MSGPSATLALAAASALLTACGSAHRAPQAQGPPDCQMMPASIHATKAYAYEVPSDPAKTPSAPAWPPGGNDQWGWMPRAQLIRVGQRMCLNRHFWRVAAIRPLPGDGKPFGILGWNGRATPTLEGQLVLLPVS